mmetsp:Transcript_19152/g.34697  ORF Transcript_19152/g.34697 Transcript_19152/m.34697 type:complete len:223 (+) Transcript_19152:572-1240(+)
MIIRQLLFIFQLIAIKNETLMIGRYTFLVLNFHFHIANRVGCFRIDAKCLARKCLDKDLHVVGQYSKGPTSHEKAMRTFDTEMVNICSFFHPFHLAKFNWDRHVDMRVSEQSNDTLFLVQTRPKRQSCVKITGRIQSAPLPGSGAEKGMGSREDESGSVGETRASQTIHLIVLLCAKYTGCTKISNFFIVGKNIFARMNLLYTTACIVCHCHQSPCSKTSTT